MGVPLKMPIPIELYHLQRGRSNAEVGLVDRPLKTGGVLLGVHHATLFATGGVADREALCRHFFSLALKRREQLLSRLARAHSALSKLSMLPLSDCVGCGLYASCHVD